MQREHCTQHILSRLFLTKVVVGILYTSILFCPHSARMYYQMLSYSADVSARADPLQVGEPPAETINRAFMDPNDPNL
jgi:hypothetical protein